jgi:membrane protease YdiL (CAAX protease family)
VKEDELFWTARAFLVLAVGTSVALAGLAAYLFASKKSWLPLQGWRPGGWTEYDVLLAFCVINFLPEIIVFALDRIGVFAPLLGEAVDAHEHEPAARLFLNRCRSVASPLTLAVTLAILFVYSRYRARPRRCGLSGVRWPANLVLGIVAFLVATPLVLGLNALITLGRSDDFLREFAKSMEGWEWLFFAFQVMVRAPILEEILFRGILLGWLRRASLGGHIAFATATLAIAIAQLGDSPSIWDCYGRGAFASVCIAAYGFWMYRLVRRFHLNATEIQTWQIEPSDDEPRRQRWIQQNASLAVFGSAILFAISHPWPGQVALLFLALVLGWLAMRTQSLIGPITVHALFNLVSLIALYGATMSGPAQNGNVATTPMRPSLFGLMTSSVPASQLPLRK